MAGSGTFSETQPTKEVRYLQLDKQDLQLDKQVDNQQILVFQDGRTGQSQRQNHPPLQVRTGRSGNLIIMERCEHPVRICKCNSWF